jgi:hypothetical protein
MELTLVAKESLTLKKTRSKLKDAMVYRITVDDKEIEIYLYDKDKVDRYEQY